MKVRSKKLILRFIIRLLENIKITAQEALMDLEPKKLPAPETETNIED